MAIHCHSAFFPRVRTPCAQDRYEVNLELVTVAGTEHTMQANLAHCENVAELEDDILCFL